MRKLSIVLVALLFMGCHKEDGKEQKDQAQPQPVVRKAVPVELEVKYADKDCMIEASNPDELIALVQGATIPVVVEFNFVPKALCIPCVIRGNKMNSVAKEYRGRAIFVEYSPALSERKIFDFFDPGVNRPYSALYVSGRKVTDWGKFGSESEFFQALREAVK